ncbi:MAG: DUF2807 domain-containing protein [Muribaculaceae bacterium]|nr:DUF2807 domain-containing protein [Muribaculaceae bacterium]
MNKRLIGVLGLASVLSVGAMTGLFISASHAGLTSEAVAKKVKSMNKRHPDPNPDSNSSRGIAELTTKSVKVANFDKIDAGCAVAVVYTQGALKPVEITAPADVMPYVKVSVSGSKLKAYIDFGPQGRSRFNLNQGDVEITVTSPQLRSLDFSSAASFSHKGELDCPNGLKVETSSASSVSLSGIITPHLNIETSSASSVFVSLANATSANIEATSASNVVMTDIKCTSMNAEVSSSATVSLTGQGTTGNFETSSAGTLHASSFSLDTANVDASSGSSVRICAKTANIDKSSGATVSNSRK